MAAGLPEDGSHGQASGLQLEFKRRVVQEFPAGETLHRLAKRHDLSRNLIRIWLAKYEAGAFDEDAQGGTPASLRGEDRGV